MSASFTWAGGTAPLVSLDYEPSVGVSPQYARFVTLPTDGPPGLAGDLTFGDGVNSFALRDCYVDRGVPQEVDTPAGRLWVFRVADRRWRWEAGYPVSGAFNSLDDHGKLIPWTVRSPYQLAKALLETMGEKDYTIDLPPGLAVPTFHVLSGDYDAGATYRVAVNGVTFEKTGPGTGAGTPTMEDVTRTLADDINAWTTAPIRGTVTATAAGGRLTVSRVKATDPLTVSASSTGLPAGKVWAAAAFAPGPGDPVIDPQTEYLGLGQNTATTGTNPNVSWTVVPAAQALAELCARYGRDVVWDPITDRVSIQRQGDGSGLPDGALTSSSPSVDFKRVPSAVVVVGGPIRFDMRFALAAVGDEWDGSRQALSRLSYAPDRDEQRMEVEVGGAFAAGAEFTVSVNGVLISADGADMDAVVSALAAAVNDETDPRVAGKVTAAAGGGKLTLTGVDPGYEFEAGAFRLGGGPEDFQAECTKGPVPVVPRPLSLTAAFSGVYADDAVYGVALWGVVFTAEGEDHDDMAGVTEALAAAIEASTDPRIADYIGTAVGSGGVLTVPFTDVDGTGVVFECGPAGTVPGRKGGKWTVSVTPGPMTTARGKGFERCPHPTFPTALPTDRLTYPQAQQLAAASVYHTFKVLGVGPADGSPGVPVPGLPGRVDNPYRFVLQDSRPAQSAPRAGDAALTDPRTGQPLMYETYNGYSKDRPAALYGSVYFLCRTSGVIVAQADCVFDNSPADAQIHVPVRVADPLRQVVRTDAPLYRNLGSRSGVYLPPKNLVLATGALVLDPATNSPIRYTYVVPIPGGLGPPESVLFDDVQQEIIGEYDAGHNLTGFRVQDNDAAGRARYYAESRAATYVVNAARTNTYAGLVPIPLSGLTRQVSWSMGRDGFFTTASANTEHSTAIPPYARRRFQEALTPDVVQRAQTMASRPDAGPPPGRNPAK